MYPGYELSVKKQFPSESRGHSTALLLTYPDGLMTAMDMRSICSMRLHTVGIPARPGSLLCLTGSLASRSRLPAQFLIPSLLLPSRYFCGQQSDDQPHRPYPVSSTRRPGVPSPGYQRPGLAAGARARWTAGGPGVMRCDQATYGQQTAQRDVPRQSISGTRPLKLRRENASNNSCAVCSLSSYSS